MPYFHCYVVKVNYIYTHVSRILDAFAREKDEGLSQYHLNIMYLYSLIKEGTMIKTLSEKHERDELLVYYAFAYIRSRILQLYTSERCLLSIVTVVTS